MFNFVDQKSKKKTNQFASFKQKNENSQKLI